MAQVRILIVEDEPLIAEDLRGHLEELGYSVVGQCDNALDAMAEIASARPDLLLLDINLGDGADGVQLAEKVNTKHELPFIFVTSHSDKATLERVKTVRPAGFVIKPFDENDLRTQIEIALARFASQVEATAAPTDAQRSEFVIADSIFIRDKGRLVKVVIDEIHYAEADDNYVTLHTPSRKYVITSTPVSYTHLVDTLYAAFTPALAEPLVDCDFSTTVQPHVEDGWSVHPNPSNGVITVVASSAIEALIITDALGRVVHRSSPFATSVSVEIPENGIYFFRIVKREGDRVGKVVIEGR